MNVRTRQLFAVKQVTLGKFGLASEVENEISVMMDLRHQNIVALHQVLYVPESQRILLVIDFAEHGSVADIMRRRSLPVAVTRSIVKQMLGALGYLHGRGLTHNDIKPSNIFAFSSGVAKLGDLGLVRAFGASMGVMGTPAFQAPEALADECDGLGSGDSVALAGAGDIWGLGVATFMMLFGSLPWQGDTVYDIIADARERPLEFPGPVSTEMADALRRMLAVRASERATLEELAALPIFRDAAGTFSLPPPAIDAEQGSEVDLASLVDMAEGFRAEQAIVCSELSSLSRLLPMRVSAPVPSIRAVGSKGAETFAALRRSGEG